MLSPYYVVLPTLGIYVVLLAVLLHAVTSLETQVLEQMAAYHTDRCTAADGAICTIPLTSLDNRGGAVVLHALCGHTSLCTAGLLL